MLVQPGGFRTGIWDDNEAAVARHRGSRYAEAYDREVRLTRLGEPMMGSPPIPTQVDWPMPKPVSAAATS